MDRLKHFDCETFLKHYWQKQPLLIRQGLSPALFNLSPEELAGLACEEGIESRLIEGDVSSGFRLSHGPFSESRFNTLPEHNWTVLVQAVDHVLPQVADLLKYFRFIPNWRMDDIMVSYAPEGGSAGPHYDNYDVFLIQASGSRQWQLGAKVDAHPELAEHSDLRLLKHFAPTETWELYPGDILYLPSRVPHWGISTSSDCMTYSVGFRSPSIAELVSECCDQAVAQLSDDHRYEDPGLSPYANPGEITAAAIENMHQQILAQLSNRRDIAQWIGCYVTQPKYGAGEAPADALPDASALLKQLQQAQQVYRDPASRFAYIQHPDSLDLYVNGRHYPLALSHRDFVLALCSQASLHTERLIPLFQDNTLSGLILALFEHGNLYFEDELYD